MGEKKKGVGTLVKAYILHGWTYAKDGEDPLSKWDDFLSDLKEHGINAELLKVPGLTSDMDKVLKLEDYILWLKKTLEKEKGKIVLIGHSNGGRIAAAFSAMYPEKVSHLVLIDSAGIFRNRLPGRIKRATFKTIAKVGKKFTKSEKLKKLLYKVIREGDYTKGNEAQRKTMQNLIYLDLSNQFQQIKTPTTIIWGKEDKITPLSDGKLIHQLITGSKFFEIEGARHSPQFTHVKEVVEKIVKEVL